MLFIFRFVSGGFVVGMPVGARRRNARRRRHRRRRRRRRRRRWFVEKSRRRAAGIERLIDGRVTRKRGGKGTGRGGEVSRSCRRLASALTRRTRNTFFALLNI